MTATSRADVLTVERFLADAHARKYRDVLEAYPDAMAHVLAILNDPDNRSSLIAAGRFDQPALSGVVRAIEEDPVVVAVLESDHGRRFRQTVGVAVRLAMEELGWTTTGRKGPVRGARYFGKAERYGPPTGPTPVGDERARALEALGAVASIGDEAERRATARELVAALARTRRSERRPF